MIARIALLLGCGLALATAACSGGHAGTAAHNPRSSATAHSSHLTATRWWSNSAAARGSRIDPTQPDAAASRLHASRAEYCRMLEQTVAAQHSILPGVTTNDPALLTSTRAFVAELEAVAPSAVAQPWRVLGPAVTSLVASRGDLAKVHRVDAAAVQRAANAIAADAKRSCGVDLAATS